MGPVRKGPKGKRGEGSQAGVCFWACLRSSQEARGFGQVSRKDFGVNPGRAWKPPRASPLLGGGRGEGWGEASGSSRKSPEARAGWRRLHTHILFQLPFSFVTLAADILFPVSPFVNRLLLLVYLSSTGHDVIGASLSHAVNISSLFICLWIWSVPLI